MHVSLLFTNYFLSFIKKKFIVKRLLNIVLLKSRTILYNINYFDRSFKVNTKI